MTFKFLSNLIDKNISQPTDDCNSTKRCSQKRSIKKSSVVKQGIDYFANMHLLLAILLLSLCSQLVNAILFEPIVELKTNPLSFDSSKLLKKLQPTHDIYPDAYFDPVSVTTEIDI